MQNRLFALCSCEEKRLVTLIFFPLFFGIYKNIINFAPFFRIRSPRWIFGMGGLLHNELAFTRLFLGDLELATLYEKSRTCNVDAHGYVISLRLCV